VKIKEIQYSRTFDLGKYRNEKIGAMADIEELDQRHIPDCYEQLKDIIHNVHEETIKKIGKIPEQKQKRSSRR